MRDAAANVIVVGSANRDYLVSADRLPAPGETVLGRDLDLRHGGKGMNQAVAAAAAGARVAFLGAVGADDAGRAIKDELARRGIDATGLRARTDAPTGAAFVTVDARGENSIIVAAGANALLAPDDIRPATEAAGPGVVFVTQLEIPQPVVEALATTVPSRGGRLLLNAAPYRPLPDVVLEAADPLVVNESEACSLAGRPAAAGVEDVARCLSERCPSVVVTRGRHGAVVVADGNLSRHPAPVVDVVDTTGAGDAFVGTVAARLADGAALTTAVAAGVAAASRSVTRRGAQVDPDDLRPVLDDASCTSSPPLSPAGRPPAARPVRKE